MSEEYQSLNGWDGLSISSVIIAMATVQVSAYHVKSEGYSLLWFSENTDCKTV